MKKLLSEDPEMLDPDPYMITDPQPWFQVSFCPPTHETKCTKDIIRELKKTLANIKKYKIKYVPFGYPGVARF